MSGLEALAGMEYLGRFIALGLTYDGLPVAVYGITGRSPSSQARRLVQKQVDIRSPLPCVSGIMVEPTDENLVAQGDKSLLIYPAMLFWHGISVSNGAQTENVFSVSESQHSIVALHRAHGKLEYEPDAPNHTPRISGNIQSLPGNRTLAALGIIKRDVDGKSERHYFEVPLVPGKGRFISTYTGANQNPLPSFRGEPLPVEIRGASPEEIARDFYDAFHRQDGKDFRVAVAAAVIVGDGEYLSAVVNRHGDGGSA